MNDVTTLKSLAALAIEHEADFEIIHGETTHKDKRVRAQMILSLTGCPEVRVLFGDAKHGQRLSSIHLASNPKVTVKQEHLLAVLADHRTASDWRRKMTRETPLFNINTAEDNMISLPAVGIRRVESVTALGGGGKASKTVDEYEVLIENHVMSARDMTMAANKVAPSFNTPTVFKTDPTIFFVKVNHEENPDFREHWHNGLQGAELVGEYIFPNTMNFHRFGGSHPSDYFSPGSFKSE